MSEFCVLPDPSPVCAGFQNINVYEIEINLAKDGEESKYIIIPGDVQEIVVTGYPTSGTKYNVFTTTDLYKNVINNSPDLVWTEWDIGETYYSNQDSCSNVTAIKVIQIGPGAVKFTSRMQ